MEATVPETKFPWAEQVHQYPKVGPPGIEYFRGPVAVARIEHNPSGQCAIIEGEHVDCLLYRNRKGHVVGILNHYPLDLDPFEKAGNVNVFVHPRRQRRGIGTALVLEARRRWDIDFEQQSYTASGLALVRHVLEQEKQ